MPKVSHFRELHVWQRGWISLRPSIGFPSGFQGGDLWAHRPDSAGGGVRSFEYRGGAYAGIYKGVSESCVDARLVGGSGNAIGIGGETVVAGDQPSRVRRPGKAAV